MVRVQNNNTSAYVSTASATEKLSKDTMANQMSMLERYFSIFDGTPEAAEKFKTAFEEAFHTDLVVGNPGGKDLSYDATMALIQSMCNQGFYVDLENIVDNGDGSVTTTVNNHIPGGPENDVTRQVVCFKDGKVVSVRPIDPDTAQFGALVKRALVFSNKEMAEKEAAMLACFDGSPDAYAKAEPIINEIVDRNVVIVHGNETMGFDDFKTWAKTYSEGRNVAKLEQISSDEDGICVTVRNIVDGVDQGPTEQKGVVRNGKIVYWSATPKNEAGFENLVSSVASKSEGMLGNIQRLRDYLAALDGSAPDAWEQFQPHIDRVLARDIVWEDDKGAAMDYDEIVCMIRDKYIPNGCYPILESVEDNQDGSLTIVVNNHLPGEDGDPTRQVLYYGDDDRIHRLTSSAFYDTCNRIRDLPSKAE